VVGSKAVSAPNLSPVKFFVFGNLSPPPFEIYKKVYLFDKPKKGLFPVESPAVKIKMT